MKALLFLVALTLLGCEYSPGNNEKEKPCQDALIKLDSWTVSAVVCRDNQEMKILDQERVLCMCKDSKSLVSSSKELEAK
jgi:hypothetical protein